MLLLLPSQHSQRKYFFWPLCDHASVSRTQGENTTPLTRMGPDSFNDCGSARICGRAAVTRVEVCILLCTRRKLQRSWTERSAKPPQTLSGGCRSQMTTMGKCGRYGTTAKWNNVDVGSRRVGPTNRRFRCGGQIAGVGRGPWDVTGSRRQ